MSGENQVQQEVSIYVGNLHKDVSDRDLYELFKVHGDIAGVNVCRNAYSKESMGYGYINFKEREHAELAMNELNCLPIKDKPIRIMWVNKDPSLRRSGKGNIIIRNLHKDITDRDLYETFIQLGKISSCKVSRNFKTGESKGYGYVQFVDEKNALTAIEQVNDQEIMGLNVKVDMFIPKRERDAVAESSWTNCFVKDFPDFVKNNEDIAELFKDCGEVASPYVVLNKQTKEPLGFAFVDFKEHEAAVKAKELFDGKDYDGKVMYVNRFQKKSERQAMLRKQHEQRKRELQRKYAGKNLYIKNLDDHVKQADLIAAFQEFGEISSCKIMTDDKGYSKGFGFICFEAKEDAQNAIAKMRNRKLPGSEKNLFVALHEPKDERRKRIREKRKQNFRYNQYQAGTVMYRGAYPPPGVYAGIPNPAYPPRVQQKPQLNIPPMQTFVNMNAEEQRTVLGELLYQRVYQVQPEEATKITGMFLKAGWPLEQKYALLTDNLILSEAINSAMQALGKTN